MTQCERIINYIDAHGSITQREAQEALGIMRLASRIHDLRRMGYPIVKETEHGKNRWNEKTSYARYKIIEGTVAQGEQHPQTQIIRCQCTAEKGTCQDERL